MEIYIAGIQKDLIRLEKKLVECHTAKESAVIDTDRRIRENLCMQRIELTEPTRISQTTAKYLLSDAKLFHDKMSDKQAALCGALAENERLQCELVLIEAEKRKLKDCISRLSLELARLKDSVNLNSKRQCVILETCTSDVFNLLPNVAEPLRVSTETNSGGQLPKRLAERLNHAKASMAANPLPVRNYNFRDD